MSTSLICRCPEQKKPLAERTWHIWPQSLRLGYSIVHCTRCRAFWRTKASYVDIIKKRDIKIRRLLK